MVGQSSVSLLHVLMGSQLWQPMLERPYFPSSEDVTERLLTNLAYHLGEE